MDDEWKVARVAIVAVAVIFMSLIVGGFATCEGERERTIRGCIDKSPAESCKWLLEDKAK